MKSRFFFKKSLSQSSSFDCNLSEQQKKGRTVNNSIDKPSSSATSPTSSSALRPIVESPATSPGQEVPPIRHMFLPLQHQSPLCQLSPISSPCSSTQGIIGCANELFFESGNWQHRQHQKERPEATLSVEKRHSLQQFEDSNALTQCQRWPIAAPGGSNQVADLVFTLAQQLTAKDAEINRLRAVVKRGEVRAERMCREFEREVERKTEELGTAKEQMSRLKKRLKSYETELEVAQRVGQRVDVQRNEETLEKLMTENVQLRAELLQQRQMAAERDTLWERERQELRQNVCSLNATLEELEGELRQRETQGREMRLELERTLVEREMARMELAEGRRSAQGRFQAGKELPVPLLELPSPRTDSSKGGGGGEYSVSSSGISSLREFTPGDSKQLELSLERAKRKLGECRAKVAHLVRAAEKVQKGERLGREELFGLSFNANEEDSFGLATHTSIDGHLAQINALQREMELLHDKFTILYARGVIGGK